MVTFLPVVKMDVSSGETSEAAQLQLVGTSAALNVGLHTFIDS